MKRATVYGIVGAGALVVAGVVLARGPLGRRASELGTDLKLISGDTGDVMASATYQRYAARREAVTAMRAALLGLAAAESTFVSDSGRTTNSSFIGRYAFVNDKSNLGPTIEILRDRWVAKIGNIHTDMSCTLTAMLDTNTWRYHAGEPICAGWTPEESTAIADAPAPVNPAPEFPAPAEPAARPRPHRDGGPVDNTPPPMPYIVKDASEGECEGCIRSGVWAACSDLLALREKRTGAAVVFTIHVGDRFTALTTDLHVEVPGMVVFRHAMSNEGQREGDQVDSIAFTPADTLYLLNSLGEGYLMWWFRGRAAQGYQFWRDINPDELAKYPADAAVLVRPTRIVRWVRIRNAAGQEGWIVKDSRNMATGGYMDELDRCLHTAKE